MTRFYYSPRFVEHRTTPGHPERPERMEAARGALERAGLIAKMAPAAFEPASPQAIQSAHSPAVIDRAEAVSRAGGGALDSDTPVSPASFEVARLAAGAAMAAVDDVLAGKSSTAFCLLRPPGHHATPRRSMGFCLFNNIAVAACHALNRHELGRILIVDWDVHHGNGTQDVFYEDDRVMFLSAHRYPFYPGSGAESETGAGKGLGFTVNMPVAYGTSRADYLRRFQTLLEAAAAKIKPELILISAGFDAHHADPIGDLGLEIEDFVQLTTMLRGAADAYCGGKLVSMLEGGYNLDAMAESVAAHVRGLIEAESSRSKK